MTSVESTVRSKISLRTHASIDRQLLGPIWEPYTIESEVLLQLNLENMTMIPDDFRQKQIALANDNPLVFLR